MNALARLGRKRRERHSQTEELIPFAVESCECLVDGAFALLRLTGTGVNAPASLVADHDRPQSFEPLPQPDAGAPGGVWRAAFAIPAEMAEPGTLLWLLDGGEYMTDVRVPPPPVAPKPTAIEASKPAAIEAPELPAVADDADDTKSHKLVEAWGEAASLREKLSDRERELAKALEELLAARTESAASPSDPRLTEALDRAERAEQEAASLRDQVERLESELSGARAQVETAAELQTELDQLKEQPKSRRRGFGRRTDDRDANDVRSELEARIAEQQERIELLEQEAASFAERRDEALTASLRERVGELEEDLRQHVATGEDLRALLASEREQVASARDEARDLKQQLATASAKRAAASDPAAALAAAVEATGKSDTAPARAGVEPPPWSALDDELLARIERAKALTS